MRRAGTVVACAQGNAIVQSPDDWHPDLGVSVVDERLERVGRVVDIIGPLDRPYIVVSPETGEPTALLGELLYVRT